jgi:hypothetical protein
MFVRAWDWMGMHWIRITPLWKADILIWLMMISVSPRFRLQAKMYIQTQA